MLQHTSTSVVKYENMDKNKYMYPIINIVVRVRVKHDRHMIDQQRSDRELGPNKYRMRDCEFKNHPGLLGVHRR